MDMIGFNTTNPLVENTQVMYKNIVLYQQLQTSFVWNVLFS